MKYLQPRPTDQHVLAALQSNDFTRVTKRLQDGDEATQVGIKGTEDKSGRGRINYSLYPPKLPTLNWPRRVLMNVIDLSPQSITAPRN